MVQFSTMPRFIQPYLQTKWIIGALVVLAIVLYVLFGRGQSETIQTITVKRGDFKQEVSISGTVVASKRVDLGFTQSGRIAHVYADEGQIVQAGALLADIDNQDLAANLSQREASLASQEAKLEALKQGTRPEEIAIAEANVASAEESLSQSNEALLDAMRDAYTAADDAVRNRVYQFVSNPRSLNPQLNFSTSDSALQTRFYNELTTLEPELVSWQGALLGATAESASALISRSQADLNAVVALLSDASGLINRAIPSTSVTQTTLDGYASSVASGRSSVNAALSALTSAQTAQKSAAASLTSAKKTLALKQAGPVQADIDAQAALVLAAKADVQNARAQISKTRIVAPFTGTVTNVDAEVGKIVSPNVAEISMMSSGVFQIESYIPEINVALVQVGNEAAVTLDAYGEDTPFSARVVSIDPAETIRDGVAMYRAILEFTKQDSRIKSGMTANVLITTEERGGVIAIPQGLVKTGEQGKYVIVQKGDMKEERAVTTGTVSSLGEVEIVSGLQDGDVVVVSGS